MKLKPLCIAAALVLSSTGSIADNASSNDDIPNYITRDVREDVFYFVMPDRFYNGNPANDLGAPEGSISHGGFDPASKWAFHGGDMAGLEQKLDYLEEMGITAIWMTPILRNKAVQNDGFAHHGYWIVDFSEIDPHFGSNADLKSLIDAAHKRDIKVFFDIITNHTADVVKYRECHNEDGSHKDQDKAHCDYKSLETVKRDGGYTPFVPEAEKAVKSPAWLNDTKYYHNQGDTTFTGENSLFGDFNGLDDINTEDPAVVEGMIEIYSKLISEFKPDGFRVDTVRHVQLPFWQAFTPAIMAHAHSEGIPNFHIFGEVYDGNPKTLSQFTTVGKLPAVLDFGFQSAVGKVLFEKASVSEVEKLFAQDHLYNDEDSNVDQLLTFLGNHDMGRVGFFLDKHLTDVSDEEKLRRSQVAHAVMFFSRGIPVIYYGDEQGFTGDGHDVDAREDMMVSKVDSYNDNRLLGTDATTAQDNFNRNHPLYKTIKTLAEVRKSQPLLQKGVLKNYRYLDDKGVMSFLRQDPASQNALLVVVNTSTTQQAFALPSAKQPHSVLYMDGQVSLNASSLTLGPLSYVVLNENTLLEN